MFSVCTGCRHWDSEKLIEPTARALGVCSLASAAPKWIAGLLSAFSSVTSIWWCSLDLLAFGMVLLDFSNTGFCYSLVPPKAKMWLGFYLWWIWETCRMFSASELRVGGGGSFLFPSGGWKILRLKKERNPQSFKKTTGRLRFVDQGSNQRFHVSILSIEMGVLNRL